MKSTQIEDEQNKQKKNDEKKLRNPFKNLLSGIILCMKIPSL